MTKPAEKAPFSALNQTSQDEKIARLSHRDNGPSKSKPVIIKKYANRRLYNTETSRYVTLEDLGDMVRLERDFLVYDAKTGEDLTHTVLTQIIVEEEGKTGSNLLPIGFLRQLIRYYGHSMEQLVPMYLEYSLSALTRGQEKYRRHFADTFAGTTIETMQEQARQNMVLFDQAMALFAPFTKFENPVSPSTPEKGAAEHDKAASSGEISDLKAQLAAMQAQIDLLSKSKRDAE